MKKSTENKTPKNDDSEGTVIDSKKWDDLLNSPVSNEMLEEMAAKAVAEVNKTKNKI